MPNTAVTVVRPGEGRPYHVLGATVSVLTPADPAQVLFADHPVPPGYEVPMHVHHDEDEMIYVIDGAITFASERGEFVAGPGSFVHLPRGAAHGFANRGPTEARMLVVASAGGGLEGVFRDLDAEARRKALDGPAISAALERNGLTLLAA